MTKTNNTKRAMLSSVLALMMCIAMLIGSTFAWFTDNVSTGKNIIAAGNLDVEMYHSNAVVKNEKVDSTVTLFKNLQGNPILWEPGVVSYENLRIVNEGDLALTYALSITTENENYVVDPSGDKYGLSQALKIGIVEGGISSTDREDVVESVNAADWTTLEDFLCCGSLLPEKAGTFEETWGVVVYWEPGTDDNRWNMNNGKTLSEGDVLSIDLGVHLTATQEQFESDSFGADYDADAVFPTFYNRFKASSKVNGKVDANNQLTEDVMIGNASGRMYALVPKGTMLKPNTTKLILTVDTTERSGNIEMTRGQISRSLDVHIEGIAETNTVPATVDLGAVMPTGLKNSSIQIYHVENGTPVQMTAVDNLTAHNQFTYHADNGDMSVNMATFSEVTAVVASADPWDGNTFDIDWYNTTDTTFTIDDEIELAGLSAIVGGMAKDGNGNDVKDNFKGKTIKLGADLDLGALQGKVWYPIGYYNSTGGYEKQTGVAGVTSGVESFEGTFDGQGHTISNIYQNTWNMFGDYNNGYEGTPNYYKDGMGIFGFVYNSTVKNLTVNNFQSDGEFSTTGVVAAYAAGTSTFENITITNSNPRAYNVPNGGVVGYAYDEDGQTNVINFTNIKIDASNKISALWGSWDVACGGVLGRMGDATKVNMTNCDVAAEIDVFNDVCGNYQYYQYRYCGMLIGTAGSDEDPADQIKNVTFTNVHVRYGDWVDYYYCELEANSKASYTEDYQFSRLEKISNVSEIMSGSTPLKAGNFICDGECFHIVDNSGTLILHKHTDAEDKQVVHIPFKQLYTGYGWGSNPSAEGVNVEEYIYSITYMQNGETLDVVYVTDNGTAKDVANTTAESKLTIPENSRFAGWVNAGSNVVTSIKIGNKESVTLYPKWSGMVHTARFVDQHGTVVYEENFTEGATSLQNVPAVPTVTGCTGAWQEYTLGKTDITIYPVYTIDNSMLSAEGVDEDGDGDIDYYKINAVNKLEEKVTIPGYINGLPCKVVTDLSSSMTGDVQEIIIEDGVEIINAKAFAWTPNLEKVSIPASVTNIGSGTFAEGWASGLGGIFGYKKVIEITYAGTWRNWIDNVCDSGWDSGLSEGSTVVCQENGTSVTYKKTGGAWHTGERYWSK